MLRLLYPRSPLLIRSLSTQISPLTSVYANEDAFTCLKSPEVRLLSTVRPEHKWLPWTTLENTNAKDMDKSFMNLSHEGKLLIDSAQGWSHETTDHSTSHQSWILDRISCELPEMKITSSLLERVVVEHNNIHFLLALVSDQRQERDTTQWLVAVLELRKRGFLVRNSKFNFSMFRKVVRVANLGLGDCSKV